MNHRELILSRAKKARHKFLELPEELQDEIIEGLDKQKLTLEAASDLAKERGHDISHAAVANYYADLRRERRLDRANRAVARLFEEFKGQPTTQNLMALVNMIVGAAAEGITPETAEAMGWATASMLRAMADVHKAETARQRLDLEKKKGEKAKDEKPRERGDGQLSEETIRQIEKDVLGIER